MLGITIVAIAMFANEIGTTIGKDSVARQKEGIYTMGFLNVLFGAVFLITLAFLVPKDFFAPGFPGGFAFSLASLPTFIPRVLLEIVGLHVTIIAIVRADRSTFGFLRILTIPLLLVVDITLGYPIGVWQVAGIALIIMSIALLFINHGIRKKGSLLVLFTAVNAVATISLFKYDITHFNSVEAEQSLLMLALLTYLFCLSVFVNKQNPFVFLRHPRFFLQASMKGVTSVILSFAYLFAPASVITTGKRSFAILWSVLAGNVYFKEKHLLIKLISFLLIIGGLVLLVV